MDDIPINPFISGLISRDRAEEMLASCRCGSFLLRVNEHVWGYAVSYKCESKCKHFLIDASVPASYQLFGIEQITHASIYQLIEHHRVSKIILEMCGNILLVVVWCKENTFHSLFQTNPISILGNELLLYPCDQVNSTPDYCDLLTDNNNHG